MRLKLHNRIYTQQARNVLLVALAFGLLSGLLQVATDVRAVESGVDGGIHNALMITRASAAKSVHDESRADAERVLAGLLRDPAVVRASITDDAGKRLAVLRRAPRRGALDWALERLFEHERSFQIPLALSPGAPRVGVLRATIYVPAATGGFPARTLRTLVASMLREMLLALVLLVLFYRSLGRPLMSAVRNLTRLNPADLRNARLPVPEQHRHDELGMLFAGINGLLVRVAASLTELDTVNSALRDSQVLFRSFLDHAPYAVNVKDRDGAYRLVNRTFCGWFGVSEQQALGRRPAHVVPDNESDSVLLAQDRQVLESGTLLRDECTLTLADGRTHALRYMKFPLFGADGGVSGVCTSTEDVTEVRRTEARLRASEDMLARAFRAIPCSLSITGLHDGRYHEVNDAWVSMLGYSREQALGATCAELGIWEDPAMRERLAARASDERVVQDVETRARAADGRLIDVLVSVEALLVDDEPQLLVAAVDITDRKRAEQALREAEHRYRTFLAAVSDGVSRFEMDRPAPLDLPEDEMIRRILEESRIAESNDVFARMHGRPDAEALRGTRAIELYDSDEEACAEVRHMLRGGLDLRDYETSSRLPDGTPIRLLETMVGIVEDGALVRGWSVLRDITERSRGEAALRESEARFAMFMRHLPGFASIKDARGCLLYVNEAFEGRLGVERERWLGRRIRDLLPAQEAASAVALDNDVLYTGEARVVNEDVHLDGQTMHYLTYKFPLPREGQTPLLGTISVDISERVRAAREVEEQRRLLRTVLDTIPVGVSVKDTEHRYTFANVTHLEIAGWSGSPVIGRRITEIEDGEDAYRAASQDRRVLEEGITMRDMEVDTTHVQSGRRISVLLSKAPLRDASDRITGVVSSIMDITERKRMEKALRAGEQRYRALYDDNPSTFLTLSTDGVLLSVNRFGAEQLGYQVDELVGRRLTELSRPEDTEIVRERLRSCLQAPERAHRWEIARLKRNGETVWIRETARVVTDQDGQCVILCVCEDISEARTLSEELSYQASHDALTGLFNRREFEHRLALALEGAHAGTTSHALCYIDLDQFKVINDTCGHVAGDELLRQLVALFSNRVRRNDTLARLGGDEFGLLMLDCSVLHARRVCDGLRDALDQFRFVWEGKTFSVGASIGLVTIDATSGSVAEVLSAADSACYAAKEQGRNRIHLFRVDDEELRRRHSEMQWVARIERALQEDRFVLNYQPIVPVADAAQPGGYYELLLRMVDEEGGTIPPGDFLGAAERYGLSPRLDRWVVDNATKWLNTHQRHLARLHMCSINLSALSLGDEDFLEHLLHCLRQRAVPPEKLCFEITETAAIANLANAMRFIDHLRSLGCHFALDDFGSGLSSYAYLRNLPVDFLKIDGVFVKNIARDPMDRAMVRSINEIGHLMDKRTIAEFVENDAVLEVLRGIGVDFAQGYGIGRPQPLAELGE